ncbi:MAG TPA: serine hydrolase domain-containing protein [Kofleriaceae bacterium]|nr:serine hydrolase domain-containing protein [Kofleriaceae bacterium]
MDDQSATTRNGALDAVGEHLRAEARRVCGSGRMPGFLAGVYHAGEQIVVAEGVANIATGAAMTEDTGYLAGSITKVMTATLMLQCVERGQVELDERVTTYLPELELAPPAKVAELRVRHLLNHTNGIDGDLFWPDQVKGRDALKHYVEELRRCSTLFDPGEYVSYSNPGMLVAGRVLEVVSGRTYHDLLEREIFGPVGMADSSTSPERGILRRTAVGHFFDPATANLRRTDMFMLPESWSACGSTAIVTIADLLAFARTHLASGVAPTGTRVLSAESAERMRTVTVDMGSPNVSPIGLGWPFFPFGETTVLVHGGSSPGGAATLLIVPAHELAFAAYGNSSVAIALADRLALWLLRDYLHLDSPDIVAGTIEVSDVRGYEGTYGSNQFRVDVKVVDGQLEETMAFEPFDDTQARILNGFTGGMPPFPPHRLVPVGDRLFAPAGVPLEMFNGFGRRMLVSFHGGTDGRPAYRMVAGRMTRRIGSAIGAATC